MITFVIVSHNTRSHLERCLASLPPHYPVIVIDNASTDGSAELATICNTRNLGFGAAANASLRAVTTPWAFLLNPDVELTSTCLPALIEATQEPQVGIIGPALVSPDGQPQRSAFPDPTLWQAFKRHIVFSETLSARLIPHSSFSTHHFDWLLGAALLIRRQCWEQIGGLDESIFLYAEDWDFCYRARQAGWRVKYVPASHVIHRGNAAGEQFGADRLTHVTLSELRVIEKHYGADIARLHRLLAASGSALRAPFSEKHRRLLRALLIGGS